MSDPERLYEGRYLRLMRRGTWEYVERQNPAGAVIIVALTAQAEVLLVEQYRVPIGARTIEMPAGLIGDGDDQGETWLASAERELLEETGYRAQRFEFISAGPSSAGMSTEQVVFARAFGVEQVHAGGGDESEQITVHRVPYCELAAYLESQRLAGYAIDPKLYAGLYFIEYDARGVRWPQLV